MRPLEIEINDLGELRSFTEIYKQYFTGIRRYISTLVLGDTILAEDLAQDVFEKVAAKVRDQFKPGTDFRKWVYCIVHNTTVNYMRKRSNQGSNNTPLDISKPKFDHNNLLPAMERIGQGGCHNYTPEQIVGLAMEAEEVYKDLDLIFPDNNPFKRAIILVMEGYNYEDIAEMEQIPIGTVSSRVHRARKELKQYYCDV